jgi:hypothetical protein
MILNMHEVRNTINKYIKQDKEKKDINEYQ